MLKEAGLVDLQAGAQQRLYELYTQGMALAPRPRKRAKTLVSGMEHGALEAMDQLDELVAELC